VSFCSIFKIPLATNFSLYSNSKLFQGFQTLSSVGLPLVHLNFFHSLRTLLPVPQSFLRFSCFYSVPLVECLIIISLNFNFASFLLTFFLFCFLHKKMSFFALIFYLFAGKKLPVKHARRATGSKISFLVRKSPHTYYVT
jgi:hypothetical protein